uniref:Uncharacterized protein n=1 Tax=Solanum tuberosum TaxID=4113 RepID=M1D679_SOLTU
MSLRFCKLIQPSGFQMYNQQITPAASTIADCLPSEVFCMDRDPLFQATPNLQETRREGMSSFTRTCRHILK